MATSRVTLSDAALPPLSTLDLISKFILVLSDKGKDLASLLQDYRCSWGALEIPVVQSQLFISAT